MVSTLKPIVGIVVTTCGGLGGGLGGGLVDGLGSGAAATSPSLSRYRIVVLPAASNPTMMMRIWRRGHSLANGSAKHEKSLDNMSLRRRAARVQV